VMVNEKAQVSDFSDAPPAPEVNPDQAHQSRDQCGRSGSPDRPHQPEGIVRTLVIELQAPVVSDAATDCRLLTTHCGRTRVEYWCRNKAS
jgi:hypothetical protein